MSPAGGPLAEFGREVVRTNVEDSPTRAGRWLRTPLEYGQIEEAVSAARVVLNDNPSFASELERRGLQRALTYKIMALTDSGEERWRR